MADIDVSTPQVPGWWFARLYAELQAAAPGYALLDSYYTNDVAVPTTADKVTRNAYKRLMGFARTNYAELVVDAPRERMLPLGFRTGADGDDTGDKIAWEMWQANHLDADAAILFRDAMTMGCSYLMVGGVDADTGYPVITIEDPRQCITIQDPLNSRRSIAGLKVFDDVYHGAQRAFLFVGGRVFKYARPFPQTFTISGTTTAAPVQLASPGVGEWEEDVVEALPAAVVPLVQVVPRRINGQPYGEFENHLSVLDRINFGMLQRLEIATLQAFKQRALKGGPTTNPDGTAIDYSDIFNADPGAMWQIPATADIWESNEVNLDPIRNSVKDDVQGLAAGTRTPLFYLTPDAQNGSAEGASLAREGLIFKTRDRIGQVGEALEQAMSLAFTFAGDTARASRKDMEVIWANPEHFSLSEKLDAASKATAAGVPWTTVMSDILQYSPQQIQRMKEERDAELAKQADAAAEAAQRFAAGAAAVGAAAGPPVPAGDGTPSQAVEA